MALAPARPTVPPMRIIETILGPISEHLLLFVKTVEETDEVRVEKRAWLFEGREVQSDVDVLVKRGCVANAMVGDFDG